MLTVKHDILSCNPQVCFKEGGVTKGKTIAILWVEFMRCMSILDEFVTKVRTLQKQNEDTGGLIIKSYD